MIAKKKYYITVSLKENHETKNFVFKIPMYKMNNDQTDEYVISAIVYTYIKKMSTLDSVPNDAYLNLVDKSRINDIQSKFQVPIAKNLQLVEFDDENNQYIELDNDKNCCLQCLTDCWNNIASICNYNLLFIILLASST